MAINPESEYPGQVEPANANYPLGGAKDETAPSAFDGTPFQKAMLNDIFGVEQALLKAAEITESGNADTAASKTSSQYLQSILHLILASFIFDDSGAANAKVLTAVGNYPAPASYEDNQTYEFIVNTTNTGATTANVETIGAKSVRLNGVVLTGGEMVATERVKIVFDFANDWFELVTDTGQVVQQVNVHDGDLQTGAIIMPYDDTIPQITEGNEFMTLAITPRKTTNKLKIDVVCVVAGDATTRLTAGLFQDAAANALSGTSERQSANEPVILSFTHHMTAGTVAATTFRVRAGQPVGGTVTFSGDTGVRFLGGVMGSSITITELKP